MENIMQKIVSLCKRKGFAYPNSEIYGGIQGFYDYGPLGAELQNNIKRVWWKWMTQLHDDIFPINGSIITHPKVWEASGHVQNFTDPLVDCKKCHKRFRADHLVEEFLTEDDGQTNKDRLTQISSELKSRHIVCPDCGGEFTEVRKFNLMVETSLGVVEGEKTTAYLKGEACQTIYLDYQNVLNSTSAKIPFGICQIGKAFRNEITPGHFLFRQREFEQWDLQWFTNPKEMEKWYGYWKEERMKWYQSLVNHKDRLRFRKHDQNELAHYAKMAFDIEYETPFGWKEWEGIHWRGDWDLSRHGKFSGNDFTYTDKKTNEKYIPWIVETSGGVDRTFLFLLIDAYDEEVVDGKMRIVLRLRPDLAPFKVAVFPLVANKNDIVEKAKSVYVKLKPNIMSTWDDLGNVGKRYRRQDEIGTPWCVTVDYQSLKDETVTVRDRDNMKQERVDINDLESYFFKKLKTY